MLLEKNITTLLTAIVKFILPVFLIIILYGNTIIGTFILNDNYLTRDSLCIRNIFSYKPLNFHGLSSQKNENRMPYL